MTQILVHLGAHRTGTTSLQLYLRDNVEILKSHRIQVICPPETRHDPDAAFTVTQPQVVLSEENLLGEMENCIWRGVLYPTLPEKLEALKRRVPQDRALCVLNIPGVAVAREVDDVNGADKMSDKKPVTLVNSVQSHGVTRQLAFFYTDPITRFVRGFENRLRQGRPHDEVLWTPAEATAFSFFASANDLAEALQSEDARLKSAAHFAFAQISDLRLNMAHFLHSAEALLYEADKGNIALCCDIEQASKHARRVADVLGATASLPRDPVQSDDRSGKLSHVAQQNLLNFLDDDYEIYTACQEISRQLGFD